METYHLLIKGKVQGVFYRDSARQEARKLGIKGWVKNRQDGSVEALATGDKDSLAAFVAWCKLGPPMAKVNEVTTTPTELQMFDSFTIGR